MRYRPCLQCLLFHVQSHLYFALMYHQLVCAISLVTGHLILKECGPREMGGKLEYQILSPVVRLPR